MQWHRRTGPVLLRLGASLPVNQDVILLCEMSRCALSISDVILIKYFVDYIIVGVCKWNREAGDLCKAIVY